MPGHVPLNEQEEKMKSYGWSNYVICQAILGIFAMALILNACESGKQDDQHNTPEMSDFPDFITPAGDYFVLSIGNKPDLDGEDYRLEISGTLGEPASFSLEALRKLDMVEQTVTIECIENPPNGNLLSTATWKGFRVYDLLAELGIPEDVAFVKYLCADGYFTYNTLEELQNRNVMGALDMNGAPIPVKYGFPLRIIFPGYYGVRQPGWVVGIQLIKSGIKDFWGETQFEKWHTDSSMTIDSKIFFPADDETVPMGENLRIGGAAYGSKRVARVEITTDDGQTWIQAEKVVQMDQDYVWVFWEADYTPQSTGSLTIRARATAGNGRVQSRDDNNYLDGTSAWPFVTVNVVK